MLLTTGLFWALGLNAKSRDKTEEAKPNLPASVWLFISSIDYNLNLINFRLTCILDINPYVILFEKWNLTTKVDNLINNWGSG